MGETTQQVLIREGHSSDIDRIYEIGTLCFTDAWRKETVAHDLEDNHSSWYIVAEIDGDVVGYGCFWFVADEGQLVNIGVHPSFRRRKLGKLLLQKGIEEAQRRQMKTMFLEVRVSNTPAQQMYEKFGFQNLGLRKKVYELPIEDGYVMEIKIQ